jgi:hypothetical protein
MIRRRSLAPDAARVGLEADDIEAAQAGEVRAWCELGGFAVDAGGEPREQADDSEATRARKTGARHRLRSSPGTRVRVPHRFDAQGRMDVGIAHRQGGSIEDVDHMPAAAE